MMTRRNSRLFAAAMASQAPCDWTKERIATLNAQRGRIPGAGAGCSPFPASPAAKAVSGAPGATGGERIVPPPVAETSERGCRR